MLLQTPVFAGCWIPLIVVREKPHTLFDNHLVQIDKSLNMEASC